MIRVNWIIRERIRERVVNIIENEEDEPAKTQGFNKYINYFINHVAPLFEEYLKATDRMGTDFDGIPLNDTGNYAIYTNQQLDGELISRASVNMGTTDVDSPTASASSWITVSTICSGV